MTTANQEFEDLMPHLIEVQGEGTGTDDWGQPINLDKPRQYRCLLDDTTTTTRTADGTTVDIALTAYVAPVPLGSVNNAPVDIKESETVKVIDPYDKTMTVTSIERHYDAEDGRGMLHNLVVRFS